MRRTWEFFSRRLLARLFRGMCVIVDSAAVTVSRAWRSISESKGKTLTILLLHQVRKCLPLVVRNRQYAMQLPVLELNRSDNLQVMSGRIPPIFRWTSREPKFEQHKCRAPRPRQFYLSSHALAIGYKLFMLVGRIYGYLVDVTRLILLF